MKTKCLFCGNSILPFQRTKIFENYKRANLAHTAHLKCFNEQAKKPLPKDTPACVVCNKQFTFGAAIVPAEIRPRGTKEVHKVFIHNECFDKIPPEGMLADKDGKWVANTAANREKLGVNEKEYAE